MLEQVSTGAEREDQFIIVDAQSVRDTDSAGAGKKVSGIKCCDIEGLPHTIGITTANVTDPLE